MGMAKYVEVKNEGFLQQELEASPFTDEDHQKLAILLHITH